MINNARVSVFSEESQREFDKDGLRRLFPFNLEENKVLLDVKKNIGFHEKIIYCYSVFLKRRGLAKKFVISLFNMINDNDKKFILNTLESRLSDNLHFFLRINKDEWLNGILEITDSGNCFHVDVSIIAFPRRRESVLSELREMLKK